MCLSIDTKGWGDGKDTYVSVGVHMMKGEFDSYLKSHLSTVRLVNQKERGRDHEGKVVELSDATREGYNSVFCRCKEGDRSKGRWGNAQFISHDDLYKPEEGKEYLMNDTLKFRVTNIVVTSV